jgi:hypothetical protein
MRIIAQVISWLSLVALIVPSCLFLAGSLPLAAVKTWMLVFTMIWFVTVPVWMDREKSR